MGRISTCSARRSFSRSVWFVLRILSLAITAAILLASVANAQSDYPARTITIVVPFAAGGATDTITRLVAAAIRPSLPVPVVVENRPGASNQVGVQAVLAQPADGYTLLAGTGGLTVLKLTNKSFELDLRKELTGVVSLGEGSLVIAVNSKLPITSLPEFIAYARQHPGVLNFGSQGAIDLLANNALRVALNIDTVSVRYGGGGQMKTALLANDVQYAVFFSGDGAPLFASGQVRPIATTGKARHPDLPNLATVRETTGADFEWSSWAGLFVKSGTPAPIIEKLHAVVTQALRDPALRKRIQELGYEVKEGSPAQFTQSFIDETNYWTKVAEQTNYKE
jgi:tripartite-type tricarboxylate transporter receptor subunit TctC